MAISLLHAPYHHAGCALVCYLRMTVVTRIAASRGSGDVEIHRSYLGRLAPVCAESQRMNRQIVYVPQ
jgi:hypothetical protein